MRQTVAPKRRAAVECSRIESPRLGDGDSANLPAGVTMSTTKFTARSKDRNGQPSRSSTLDARLTTESRPGPVRPLRPRRHTRWLRVQGIFDAVMLLASSVVVFITASNAGPPVASAGSLFAASLVHLVGVPCLFFWLSALT